MSSCRVAVIGAGPAGLVAARRSVNEGHRVVVYEQHSSVGGIWVFAEDPKHHSALYEDMKTNLPKEMMMYNGHPYPNELPSFMSSQNVLDYLEKYAEGLPIRFSTKVTHVSRKDNQWKIESESLGKKDIETFDVVFVCNGHYVQPRIPFDTTKFKGKLIHSHDYRRAKVFEGMRVAVVGTGPSGIDVALQLAGSSKEVLFIGNRAKYPVLPKNIHQYSTHVIDMLDDKLILASGEELSGVEAVVVCTGYNMDFPFLEEGIVEVVHDGQMVSPLWQHVVHKDYPSSLFFIGLNLMVVTMTLFEHQVRFALSLVAKRAAIPTRAEMDEWEDQRMKFLEKNDKTPKQFHSMTDDQWAYMDELADLGKFERWPHHKVMAKMYSYIFKIRSEDVINYKKVNFEVDGEDFTVTTKMVTKFLLFFITACFASNPPSVVLDLNEKFIEVKDEGFWIVKFYAPWCAHCKRIAPTWEHLGHALQDKSIPIRVAKMDCTRFQSACQTLAIRGYPTIIFFRNGKPVEFHGERSKEALLNFAEKCAAEVVEKVNAVKISDMRKKSRHDPFFVITSEASEHLQQHFTDSAEKLFSKVRFVTAPVESVPQELRDSGAHVAVFKDDTFVTFKGEPEELSDWVLRERWPMMPQAMHSNIAEMATSGKLLVLAAVSDLERFNHSSPVGQFYKTVETAAKELKKSEILWEQYQFAWLDGADIIRGIAMTKMDEPAIIVFNYSTYEFFLPFDEPEKMTSQSIITWLEQLSDGISGGSITPMGGRGWTTRIRRIIYDVYTNVAQMFASQPLLSCCLFGVPIAFLSIICYSICSADFTVERDEFYPDEEEEEILTDSEEQHHENYDPDHQKNE